MNNILCPILVIAFMVSGAIATAQQPSKTVRVAILAFSHQGPNVKEFHQELRRLGWVEGQNIAFDLRTAEGKIDRVPQLAADIVRLKPEVILASATPSALALQKATSTIPIVFTVVADPVGSGLIKSLARPGGNITGVTNLNRELSAKRLELLKETLPKVSRVAVLSNPADPISAPQLKDVETVARPLHVQLLFVEASKPSDYENVERALAKMRPGALFVVTSQMFAGEGARIIAMAENHKLPSMLWTGGLVEAGGLMSYGVNVPALYRRAAVFVDKILKGAKPADLPAEQPMKFEFVINLKTAKAIGITIPPNVLARADRVIR